MRRARLSLALSCVIASGISGCTILFAPDEPSRVDGRGGDAAQNEDGGAADAAINQSDAGRDAGACFPAGDAGKEGGSDAGCASCLPDPAQDCIDGVFCGGICCQAGERCVGGACRCGDGAACQMGQICSTGGPVGVNGCGTICCTAGVCPQ